MIRTLAVALVAFAVVGAGYAQPFSRPAPTIEWLAIDATNIVRGKILSVKEVAARNGALWQEVTLQVEETYKGDPQPTVTFISPLRWAFGKNEMEKWHENGNDMLLFLKPREVIINQDGPVADLFPNVPLSPIPPDYATTIDLESEKLNVLTKDLHVLQTKTEILARTRGAVLEGKRSGVKGSFSFHVPFPTPDAALLAFMNCHVIVPLDESLRSLANQWLKSPTEYVRRQGQDALKALGAQ